MRLTRRVHSQKLPLNYSPLPTLCTRLVSRIFHAGAVANVDFKLFRSMLDGNKVRRKVESASSEAKIVGIGEVSLTIFPSRPKRGPTDYPSLLWREKLSVDSNFGEKTAAQSRSFEIAVSSLDFVYRKLEQTPENA